MTVIITSENFRVRETYELSNRLLPEYILRAVED